MTSTFTRSDAACLAIGHRPGRLERQPDGAVHELCPRCKRDLGERSTLWRLHATLATVSGSRDTSVRELVHMSALITALVTVLVILGGHDAAPLLLLPLFVLVLTSFCVKVAWSDTSPQAMKLRDQNDAELAEFHMLMREREQREADERDTRRHIAELRERSQRRVAMRRRGAVADSGDTSRRKRR